MSEFSDAVAQMERAANGLRFYIKHNCMYGATDSPEGDVCTCGRMNAVNEANKALAVLRAWADAEISR